MKKYLCMILLAVLFTGRNNEYLESKEVKNFFIRGASRNPDLVYPNREWGYGRLNVAGTFDVLAGL